jgi:hypothetical protein
MLLRKDAPVQRDGVLPLQHNQWARALRDTTRWGQALGTPCLQGHRGVRRVDDEDLWAGPLSTVSEECCCVVDFYDKSTGLPPMLVLLHKEK